MQKWMEDRCNLDIDIIALPGWSDATSKISLLMGDETQRPDIIWWWNMEADYTGSRLCICCRTAPTASLSAFSFSVHKV